jgi:hypothetical protein
VTDSMQDFSAQPTAAGLMRFLDWAMEKGYLKQATGQAMKTACREVLSATEGDTWERTELASLETNDTLQRFETRRAMKYSSGSLSSYKSRFQKSLSMFEEYLDDPSQWRPTVKSRTRSARSKPGTGSPDEGSPRTTPVPSPPQATSSNVVTYPFPLREGVLVSLQLPADLTKREAARLATFVDSLALESPANPASDAVQE